MDTEVSAPAVQLNFDYDQFGDSRDSMIQLACEIKFAGAVAAAAAFRVGEALREAQRLVPKGQWLKWLKAEFQWSGSKAYDLMSLPQNLSDFQKSGNLDKLDYSAAVELARDASAPIRHEVEVLLAKGERVTFKRVIEMLGVREPGSPPKAPKDKGEPRTVPLRLRVVSLVTAISGVMLNPPADALEAMGEERRIQLERLHLFGRWLEELFTLASEDGGDGQGQGDQDPEGAAGPAGTDVRPGRDPAGGTGGGVRH